MQHNIAELFLTFMEPPGFAKEILVGGVEGRLEAETRKKFTGRDEPGGSTVSTTAQVKPGTFCPGNHECGTFGVLLICNLCLQIRSVCP